MHTKKTGQNKRIKLFGQGGVGSAENIHFVGLVFAPSGPPLVTPLHFRKLSSLHTELSQGVSLNTQSLNVQIWTCLLI